MLNPINLTARDLPDAWFQALYACVEHGSDHLIDSGSFAGQYRKELDYITVHIKDPGFPHDRLSNDDLCPKIPAHYGVPNPVTENYIDEYLPYLMSSEIKEGESYTYGSRFWDSIRGSMQYRQYLNQVESVIYTYKSKGHRNNQMVLQVAEPFDLLLSDPPCLRHLDTRIQDNKLHFFVYFRSWDLWGGFPSNLALIQILKEYMAQEIGVEDGEMIVSSKGLHLYDHVWDIARKLKGGE
jgi:thymidylate synthase